MTELKTANPSAQKLTRRATVSPLLWELAQGDPSSALKKLGTSREGLTGVEVERRRRIYGKNEIAHEKSASWRAQAIKIFANPFILVLVVLGIVSYVTDVYLPEQDLSRWRLEHNKTDSAQGVHPSPQTYLSRGSYRGGASLISSEPKGDWIKVIILTAMITLSGLLRFWQEYRSVRAAQRLRAMVPTRATLSRLRSEREQPANDGSAQDRQEIPIAEIVPGDIVHLSAGDMIPADVRVISAKDLFVSQSVLTGESMPVEKHDRLLDGDEKSPRAAFARRASPLEMDDLCFTGTNVVSGTATAVVVATGSRTFFGSIAAKVLGHRATTSFDAGVNQVTFVLIRFMLLMVPIVMVINGLTKGDWKEAVLFGLAVAVGLTPEMLPFVVSANLARGAIKLSKNKVIVKRLNSIQTFGAMDVLCTDKTGTLTENKVVLVRHLDPSGKNSRAVLKYAYLNSFFQTGLKNLLDTAIIEKAEERALGSLTRHYFRLDEVPFDFVRRRMSVILSGTDLNRILVCKGATEEVLAVCTRIGDDTSQRPLTDLERKQLRVLRNDLNADGMRVLAVAWRPVAVTEREFSSHDENNLVLAGFIAFLDPPKASAGTAIKAFREHGVRVKVITGDSAAVAAKVCQEVGLNPGDIVLGHEIEDMNDEELGFFAEGTNVFAKMNPHQKARVVRALKARGHTVGFLGDGINDAVALRTADVGISVDTGVDIAKESADIILLEKSLMVLEQGIIQGRVVFGNIVKYIKMTASSNFGNAFSVLAASAFLPFLPMAALQLLIQNLLYDLSQLSLPWDSMDKEFVQRPRKWDAPGLARFMIVVGPISSVFDISTFFLLWYVFGANSAAHQSLFQSGWFVEGLLSQTLIVHMIRTQKIPFLESRAAAPVLLLTSAIMMVGLVIPFTRFGANIGLQPLPGAYFPWLAATLLTYCVITQFVKLWYLRRFRGWL